MPGSPRSRSTEVKGRRSQELKALVSESSDEDADAFVSEEGGETPPRRSRQRPEPSRNLDKLNVTLALVALIIVIVTLQNSGKSDNAPVATESKSSKLKDVLPGAKEILEKVTKRTPANVDCSKDKCTRHEHCCEGLFCNKKAAKCKQCVEEQKGCVFSVHCCGSLACIERRCNACVPEGYLCAKDDECCADGAYPLQCIHNECQRAVVALTLAPTIQPKATTPRPTFKPTLPRATSSPSPQPLEAATPPPSVSKVFETVAPTKLKLTAGPTQPEEVETPTKATNNSPETTDGDRVNPSPTAAKAATPSPTRTASSETKTSDTQGAAEPTASGITTDTKTDAPGDEQKETPQSETAPSGSKTEVKASGSEGAAESSAKAPSSKTDTPGDQAKDAPQAETASSDSMTEHRASDAEVAAKTSDKAADTKSDASRDTEKETPQSILDALPPGLKRPKRQYSTSYVPRRPKLDDDRAKELAERWGSWTLVDEKVRPWDVFGKYPNRDAPRSEFPKDSWQLDKEYLARFLDEGIALVDRAQRAILAEYGHDDPDKPIDEISDMFTLSMVNLTEEKPHFEKDYTNAGWTTTRGFNSLVRRLLHAIMTEDKFTFVMGGHSAAAGHGNHFQQSYTMQVQMVLEPVFARLGVYMQSFNFGMGGLGTLQSAMGAGDIYGRDIDILYWDSGMTEKDGPSVDLFVRQTVASGLKVPLIWGGPRELLLQWHKNDSLDVGEVGGGKTGFRGIPQCSTRANACNHIPWAARFLDCSREINDVCNDKKNRFSARCWIERDDFKPPTKQYFGAYPSQAKWHPGSKAHRLRGRVIAFTILRGLREALRIWKAAPDFDLPDEAWFMTPYYTRVKEHFHGLENGRPCFNLKLPDAFCNRQIQGRTEFTPRRNPFKSSIRSILKTGVKLRLPDKNVYDPPDVGLDDKLWRDPGRAVNYLDIIENGVSFSPLKFRKTYADWLSRMSKEPARNPKLNDSIIPPGLGTGLSSISAPANCDGSIDSFCGRSAKNNCLLSQHNDYRGGLLFDGLSGWIVMNLENVRLGVIVVKLESFHLKGENPATKGWKCVNNKCGGGEETSRELTGSSTTDGSVTVSASQRQRQRRLELCDSFKFSYALDGEITTWDKDQFLENRHELQRVVETWTLLDNPDFVEGDGEAKDVELAINIGGCDRDNTFTLTHVYWA